MASRQDVQKRRVWEARLERFRTSGLTVARFCAQEGVSAHTFYYWARRVAAASTLGRTCSSQRAGSAEGSRPTRPAASGNGQAAWVRFQLPAAVEVSVPADCLDAIRCLAECLTHGPAERSAAFQEVVVCS